MIDDVALLKRFARDGSQEAFAELVRRHLTVVYSAAFRRTDGDAHRAKDVAQVVFTALARNAPVLSRRSALIGWLHAATRSAAIDILRAERRRQVREEKARIMNEIAASPDASTDWEQLRPVLDEAIDELDAPDRDAVLLRFFAEQPIGTVATALRLNEDAARKRISRALDKLGALLAKRGITSTSSALAVLLANQTSVAVPAGVGASITATAVAELSATAGATAVPGISIMNTWKIAFWGAAITALVAVGFVAQRDWQPRAARPESKPIDSGAGLPKAAVRDTDTSRSTTVADTPSTPKETEKGQLVAEERPRGARGGRGGGGGGGGGMRDDPAMLERYVSSAVPSNMAQRDAEYTQLFSTLGLSNETAVQLKKEIAEVYAAKMRANHGVGNFAQVQAAYDARIKALLEHNYDFYREHEEAFPSRREYDYLSKFATAQGLPLVGSEESQVEKLIRETGAYAQTVREWGGPYQAGPPPPIEGREKMVELFDGEITRIQRSARALLQKGREAGLSASTLAALDAYYASEVGSRLEIIEDINNPMAATIKRLESQLETLRNSPTPNPGAITRLERQLNTVRASAAAQASVQAR